MTLNSSQSVEVTVLGTGTSHGVPMIGCECPVCTSDDPHDRRTRCSIVVRCAGMTLLVDTTPELRLQCLAQRINHVDAVLFTHHHADHVMGLDDLRRFNHLKKGVLPIYGMPGTLDRLQGMFPYAFETHIRTQSSKPDLTRHEIDAETFRIGEAAITPIPLMHGHMPVLGFRFGDFAYCTDCNHIPESSFTLLEGVTVLILDALRRRPHPTHFSLDEAVEASRRIGARQTYFTHIAHDLAHASTNAALPEGMKLAHDGLRFTA